MGVNNTEDCAIRGVGVEVDGAMILQLEFPLYCKIGRRSRCESEAAVCRASRVLVRLSLRWNGTICS